MSRPALVDIESMFEFWKQSGDTTEIQPADSAFTEIQTAYRNRGPPSVTALINVLADHHPLTFMYLEDEYGLTQVKFVHHVFKLNGMWFGIKDTKASPNVVPVNAALLGDFNPSTQKVPSLAALLASGTPKETVTPSLRNGVVLIPSIMSALDGVNTTDFAQCSYAIGQRVKHILTSRTPTHLWTGGINLADELIAFREYAATVLQWTYLAGNEDNGAIIQYKPPKEGAPNDATVMGQRLLHRLVKPADADDDIQDFDSDAENRNRTTNVHLAPTGRKVKWGYPPLELAPAGSAPRHQQPTARAARGLPPEPCGPTPSPPSGRPPATETVPAPKNPGYENALHHLLTIQSGQLQREQAAAATSAAPNKSRFDGLIPVTKNLLLAATASPDPSRPALALRPALLQFHNCSKDQILQECINLLKPSCPEQRNDTYDGIVDQGLAMMLRWSRFIPQGDSNHCVSVFVTTPDDILRGYGVTPQGLTADEWELGFHGHSDAGITKIKEVTKVSYHACSDFFHAIRQMRNWQILLSQLFGPTSTSSRTMEVIIQKVRRAKDHIGSKAHRNPRYMPGIMQMTHHLFVKYFERCSWCTSDQVPPQIDITFLSHMMDIQGDFAHQPLDALVEAAVERSHPKRGLKQPRPDETHPPGTPAPGKRPKKKVSPQPPPPSGNPRTDANHPGFNKWHNSQLRADHEQFTALLRAADSVPTFNATNQPPCLNFHIHGGCKRGAQCTRAATHAQPTAAFESALAAWRTASIA